MTEHTTFTVNTRPGMPVTVAMHRSTRRFLRDLYRSHRRSGMRRWAASTLIHAVIIGIRVESNARLDA